MWGKLLFICVMLCSAPVWAATERAVFAAGHFWHAQATFDAVPGVVRTVVGYAGGRKGNPNYAQVMMGNTGHYEVVEVTYDADKISYEQLVHVFLRMIDPTDMEGQFCHRGAQYRPAIFYASESQRQRVQEVMMLFDADSQRFDGGKALVPALPLNRFYVAEESHQKYYRKNALRYGFLEQRCGRQMRLRAVWGR